MTITDALIAEHRVFTDLFDHIEGVLPTLTTLAEVKLLAALVGHLLQSHADAEKNLAYVALDHALKDKGPVERLHQDHHEIDASLAQVGSARRLPDACRLFKAAIAAGREHFQREEQSVFPLLEGMLERETLAALGAAHARLTVES
jgi:hemerythrin-like domain-containing protein